MQKQPTFQALQGVSVIDHDHPRAGHVGKVVDVKELPTAVTVKNPEGLDQVITVDCVKVTFDQDDQTEAVPVSSLMALS